MVNNIFESYMFQGLPLSLTPAVDKSYLVAFFFVQFIIIKQSCVAIPVLRSLLSMIRSVLLYFDDDDDDDDEHNIYIIYALVL